MAREVKFSAGAAGSDRVFHINEADVRIVLDRLPAEARGRLRRVHFNDAGQGARLLGYVTGGRREIALCALPPRMSLTRFLVRPQSPKHFGAKRGTQWPTLAIRRYLLYDVLLQVLGHLQIIDEDARSDRRKFADESKAREFAMSWRQKLWAAPFEHADPVHNAPGKAEILALEDV